MTRVYEGDLLAEGLRFGIVVSRFNDFFSGKLLDGGVDHLRRHGASSEDIEVAWVPGGFEIPLVAGKMAKTRKYDAILCLGAIIRGDTPHFEYVAAEVAKGIASVSLEEGIPVIFGIITADTLEQAVERSGTKAGNKGADAAETAIEMANLLRQIEH